MLSSLRSSIQAGGSRHRIAIGLSSGGRSQTTKYVVNRRLMSSNSSTPSKNATTPTQQMTKAERDKAIHDANKSMEGYAQTRILKKKGLLKSKRPGQSEQSKAQHKIQLALFLSLAGAFIVSPILGRKIAQDDEFREKYIPSWYDFRIKSPESAWTRAELHQQILDVEADMRQRAINGEFTPEKLTELKNNLQARSDLTEEDLYYAKKYGWGSIHPGVDPDDDDDDDE